MPQANTVDIKDKKSGEVLLRRVRWCASYLSRLRGLMFRSGLAGRRMALVGLVGGAMLATSGVAVLLGAIPQGSAVQGIATIPEVVWEAFLGLYLTFKGFKPSPILTPESWEHATAPAYAAA